MRSLHTSMTSKHTPPPPQLPSTPLHNNRITESKETYLEEVLNFGICEAVLEWAHGTSFLDIIEVTQAREGSLIREITRLDNLCREFRTAARYLGDATLQDTMYEVSGLIRRDIVFCGSLYLD